MLFNKIMECFHGIVKQNLHACTADNHSHKINCFRFFLGTGLRSAYILILWLMSCWLALWQRSDATPAQRLSQLAHASTLTKAESSPAIKAEAPTESPTVKSASSSLTKFHHSSQAAKRQLPVWMSTSVSPSSRPQASPGTGKQSSSQDAKRKIPEWMTASSSKPSSGGSISKKIKSNSLFW